MQQIGVVPDLIVHCDIDERPKSKEPPSALAKRLACEKARAAWGKQQGSALSRPCILAADTVVAFRRSILPKPRDFVEAENHLRLLSGVTHKVFTAVCLLSGNQRMRLKLVETRVRFALLSQSLISSYIKTQEWRGKAGGYAIQGKAAAFVERIVGSYTNVVGLPLAETMNLLASENISVFGTGNCRVFDEID